MQQGGGGGGADAADRRQHLHEGDAARGRAVVLVLLRQLLLSMLAERMGGGVRVGTAVVLGGRPGDDVSAVVRARASVLAEVELERLNLQQKGGRG